MTRQTFARIHLQAIVNNFCYLKELNKQGKTVAVIKADAYGHGSFEVANSLSKFCDLFAVAITEEAVALRDKGFSKPILILQGAHEFSEVRLAAELGFTIVIHTLEQLKWWTQTHFTNRPKVWLKLDTGMHRLGFTPETLCNLFNKYHPVLNTQPVLMTHFHSADEPNSPETEKQLQTFSNIASKLQCAISIANSPATLAYPLSHGNWNRTGIAMYGSTTLPSDYLAKNKLMAGMTLMTSIIALRQVRKGETVGYGGNWTAARDSLIATAGIGYADGYPRHLSNGAPVLINQHRASVVGNVSMDMIGIDVTDVPKPQIGSPVELWGNTIPIDEVAKCADSIGYELMTRLSQRVPRVF